MIAKNRLLAPLPIPPWTALILAGAAVWIYIPHTLNLLAKSYGSEAGCRWGAAPVGPFHIAVFIGSYITLGVVTDVFPIDACHKKAQLLAQSGVFFNGRRAQQNGSRRNQRICSTPNSAPQYQNPRDEKMTKGKRTATTITLLFMCTALALAGGLMPLQEAMLPRPPLEPDHTALDQAPVPIVPPAPPTDASPAAALPPVNAGPIALVGDAALDAFCAGNGTTGSSWATAHVIQDLVIDVNYQNIAAFTINATSRYLIIRNCTLNGTVFSFENYVYALELYECSNIRVENCSILGCMCAIYFTNCENLEFLDNYIHCSVQQYYMKAVLGRYSNLINMQNNYINASVGILVGLSANIHIANNTILSALTPYLGSNYQINIGVYSSAHTLIENNHLMAYPGYSYIDFLYDGCLTSSNNTNIVIQNNTGTSLAVYQCTNAIIRNNAFSTPPSLLDRVVDHLVILSENKNSSFTENTASRKFGSKSVIQFRRNQNCTIANNIIENSSIGILSTQFYTYNNEGNYITNNLIRNCEVALNISDYAEYNTIYNNEFMNSTTQFIDVDLSTTNRFDFGGIGNVWEDYTVRYPAASAVNGIWNTSYEVELGTEVNDSFPLQYRRLISPMNGIAVSCPTEITVPSVGQNLMVSFSGAYPSNSGHGVFLIWLNGSLWGGGGLHTSGVSEVSLDDLAPGTYAMTIKAYPEAGEIIERAVTLTVIGSAPPSPVLLTPSQIRDRGEFFLQWAPIYSPFASGYNVYINNSLIASFPVFDSLYEDRGLPEPYFLYSYWVNSTTITLSEPGYYYIHIAAINEYGATPSAMILIAVEPNELYPQQPIEEIDVGIFGGAEIWVLALLAGSGFGLGAVFMLILTRRKSATMPPPPGIGSGNTKIFTTGPNMPSYLNNQNNQNPNGGNPPTP
jgi:nitrous oxidase accessory protein NosD